MFKILLKFHFEGVFNLNCCLGSVEIFLQVIYISLCQELTAQFFEVFQLFLLQKGLLKTTSVSSENNEIMCDLFLFKSKR
jgi:hypothetical protein